MTFGAPLWLFALPALAVAAIWLARRAAAARAALPGPLGALGRDRSGWRSACEGLGGALVVAGLALPRFEVPGGAAPRPALLVVDVSRSMLAEDESGSRFAAAKRGVAEALAALSGRRVGLIVFAGASEEIAPPTSDFAALRALLDEIDPRRTLEPGSAPAPALERALQRLPEGGDVVLFSDGEWDGDRRHEDELAAAATRARVALHVVPLGGAEPVELVTRDAGGAPHPLLDGEGQPTRTRADRARIEALAAAGRGHVVADGAGGRAFEFLAAERRELRAPVAAAGATPATAALALALLLLALAHGLRERTS